VKVTANGSRRACRDRLPEVMRLALAVAALGCSSASVAGLKFTPAETPASPPVEAVASPALDNSAAQTSSATVTTIESHLPGSRPEAFERESKMTGGMRMVPVGGDFEELKLRWEKNFGGSRTDAFTRVISRRSDLATIAVGHTLSQSSGRSDAWVVALDSEGDLLWQQSIGGPRDDRANAAFDLADGSLLVVGDTASEDSGRLAGLVARLAPDGELVWRRALAPGKDVSLKDVIEVADGRLVVAGTQGKVAGYVAELDADGNVVWERTLADSGPDIVRALAKMPNGEILLVGERTNLFDSDAWAMRLSPAGEPVWSRSYGSEYADVFNDVVVLTNGSVIAVGSTYTENALEQGWLVKVTADEAAGWEKTFGGTGVDTLWGATLLNDQSLILVGQTNGADESVPNSWVLRVTDQGALVKARVLGGEYADGLAAIAARSDGSFAAVGFLHPDFDAPRDAYVALLGTPRSQQMRPVYAADDAPTLFVPGGGQLITERSSVEVLGNVVHSRPVQQLFIDGKQAEILPNGAFVKQLSVPLGQTEITIDAVDDRGVIGSTTVTVVRTEQGQLHPGDDDVEELLASIDFGRYHALVIGNNDYNADDIPKLESAVNDAETIASLLESDYSFDVDLRLNASRKEILSALEQKSQSLGPNDNLLVYYAGHGYYDEDVDLGYWLPVDASLANKDAWIRNSAITDTIKGMKAKHVMLVADSCFSGTLLRSVDVKRTGRFYEQMANRSARLVMTSGGIEPVMDQGGDGHSVFARNLIRKLRTSDRIIDGTSLYQAIREPVVMTSEQVPQYSNIRFIDSDGGDFLFVKQ